MDHGGGKAVTHQTSGQPFGAALGARENQASAPSPHKATGAGHRLSARRNLEGLQLDSVCRFQLEPKAIRIGTHVVVHQCGDRASSVAEKHKVCRAPGKQARILRIAGRKPMSSIRSASSRISMRHAAEATSCGPGNPPGVPAWRQPPGPGPKRLICALSDRPPITRAAAGSPASQLLVLLLHLHRQFARRNQDERLHVAEARQKTLDQGDKNASVLPVPVWAVARMSLPASACGSLPPEWRWEW